jgi:hypothetical protein
MLASNGFLHIHNKKTYWKCSENKKLKCQGQFHVLNESIAKFIKHNYHIKNAAKVDVKKAVSYLKDISFQTTLSTYSCCYWRNVIAGVIKYYILLYLGTYII